MALPKPKLRCFQVNIKSQLLIELHMNQKDKKDIIKSLLKYNPNKPYDVRKIRQIEQELNRKFMRKNQSEAKLSLIVTNEQKNTEEKISKLQEDKNLRYQQQSNWQSAKHSSQPRTFYEALQNQFKTYVKSGSSNYQFFAQKQLNRNRSQMLSPLNHLTSQTQMTTISNIKTHDPTSKMKKLIIDKSQMNKSQLKIGIHMPSPVVYKHQIGFHNQSQLRRYEHVISKLQQLAIKLDLNKNLLSAQRPILRNFNELHSIATPVKEGETVEDCEEKIIAYVEKRKFLEVNDIVKQLQTIEDHFEYAVNGTLPQKIMNFNGSQLNITQSTTEQSRIHNTIKQSQKVVYNEGCGIAFVNEQSGDIDASTVQYFEIGVSLSQIYSYLKVLADVRQYVILEGHARKIFQYVEDDSGKGKWIKIELGVKDDFIFESKTLYAIAALKNLTHN